MNPVPLGAGLGGLAALALCAAAAVATADPPPNAASSNAPATPATRHVAKLDKGSLVTCRDVAVTGSHISTKRVCKTNREWDDEATQTEQIIQQDRMVVGAFPH